MAIVVRSHSEAGALSSVTTFSTPSTGWNTLSGSSFLVAVGNGVVPSNVTDNKGNTYTQLTPFVQQNTYEQGSWWWCENGVGGTNHIVTITLSSGDFPGINALELSDGSNVVKYDTTPGKKNISTVSCSPAGTAPFSTNAFANSAGLALSTIFAGGSQTSATYTPTGGWTMESQLPNFNVYWAIGTCSKAYASTTALSGTQVINDGAMLDASFISGGFYSVSSGTTAALTAVSATASPGAVGAQSVGSASGAGATGSAGTVGFASAVPATGVTGTASVSSVASNLALALSGASSSGAPGSAVPNTTIALNGVSGTSSTGTVTPGQGSSVALTGVSGSATPGTVAPSTALQIAGSSGTGSAGSVVALISPSLSGVTGTGSVGTVGAAIVLSLTGVSGSTSAGTLTPSGQTVTVGLSGVTATGSVGSVSAPGGVDTWGSVYARTRKKKKDPDVLSAPVQTVRESIEEVFASMERPLINLDEDEDEILMLLV